MSIIARPATVITATLPDVVHVDGTTCHGDDCCGERYSEPIILDDGSHLSACACEWCTAPTTSNPLAPDNINRRLRDAVAARLHSDAHAGLSTLDVMVLANGDLMVRSFLFRLVATFIGDTVTVTRHATGNGDKILGTLTTDGGVGSTPLAAILTALADH
jgi:hypothetical protein